MENNGGIESRGAHFEKVVVGDEIMGPDNVMDARFSILSLAVAADSGWYEIDLKAADEFNYGKNKGCRILDSKCRRSSLSEFCHSLNKKSCSDDLRYLNICQSGDFTGQCSINLPQKSCKRNRKTDFPAFTYGRNSICQKCEVCLFIIFND
jgi:hypothetical protein